MQAHLDELEVNVILTVSLLETAFPGETVVLWHHFLHVVKCLRRFGPVFAWWMFFVERTMHYLVLLIKKRDAAEANLARAVSLAQVNHSLCVRFMSVTPKDAPAYTFLISKHFESTPEMAPIYAEWLRGYGYKMPNPVTMLGKVVPVAGVRDSDTAQLNDWASWALTRNQECIDFHEMYKVCQHRSVLSSV